MANIRSNFGASNYESGIKKLDVRDFIFQLDPDEAPFTTLLSRIPKERTTDVQFFWFEDAPVGKWTQVNYSGGYNQSATSIVVDDADIFLPGDVVKVVSTGEILLVTAVNTTTNTLTVTRGWGTTAAGNIADDAYLYRLGNAQVEGWQASSMLVTTKVQKSNYIQLFSRVVKFTDTANAVATYGGRRRDLERKKVGIELKKDIETQFLFGEPKLDSNGPRYQTGGALYFMGSVSPALNAGTFDKSAFDGWLKNAMMYGSSEKVLMASPNLLAKINNLAASSLQTQTPYEKKDWGVTFTRYISPFGSVLLVYNKNLVGPYNGYGFLFDMKELVYRYLDGLDLSLELNIQNNDTHVLMDEYSGQIGLEMHSALKHGLIYGA